VVVSDFDIERISAFPTKTNPPLIIDPDAVLTPTILEQFLESIARRYPEVFYRVGRVQNQELSKSEALNVLRELSRPQPVEHLLGLRISKAPNHGSILTQHVINVKRYHLTPEGYGAPL
jgi:hypothetical protein